MDDTYGYSADDRKTGDQPGSLSVEALRRLWEERDSLYEGMSKPLNAGQIEAIRKWRLAEVNELPVNERGPLAMQVLAWSPPVNRLAGWLD